MPTIIDWLEYDSESHVVAWFLLEAMTKVGIKERFGAFDSSKLEVELRVNGVEVPVLEPLNFLQSQLDALREEGRRQGMRDAADLIAQNTNELNEVIGRILDVSE